MPCVQRVCSPAALSFARVAVFHRIVGSRSLLLDSMVADRADGRVCACIAPSPSPKIAAIVSVSGWLLIVGAAGLLLVALFALLLSTHGYGAYTAFAFLPFGLAILTMGILEVVATGSCCNCSEENRGCGCAPACNAAMLIVAAVLRGLAALACGGVAIGMLHGEIRYHASVYEWENRPMWPPYPPMPPPAPRWPPPPPYPPRYPNRYAIRSPSMPAEFGSGTWPSAPPSPPPRPSFPPSPPWPPRYPDYSTDYCRSCGGVLGMVVLMIWLVVTTAMNSTLASKLCAQQSSQQTHPGSRPLGGTQLANVP